MSRGLILKVTYRYLSSVLLRKDCPLLLISFYLYFKPRFSPLCYIKLHFLWYISLRVFKNICGVSSFNFDAIFHWNFFKNFCDTSSFHLVSLSGTRKEIMCPWWPVKTFHNLCSPLWTPIELLTLVSHCGGSKDWGGGAVGRSGNPRRKQRREPQSQREILTIWLLAKPVLKMFPRWVTEMA